jgi:hypothetical protein
VDALAYRTTRAALSSPTGAGEKLEAGFRWWEERPKLWVSLTAPRLLGLPGIGSLEAYFERQSYAIPGSPSEESWRGARLSLGDWLSSRTKARIQVGFHRENSLGSWVAWAAASIAGSRRIAFLSRQTPRTGSRRARTIRFRRSEASAKARLIEKEPWFLRARLDARLVTKDAPLAVWPGAGSDNARPLLLRGYPLLDEGVIRGEGFGPRLLHGSLEAERTMWNPGIVKLGLATFVDWARILGPDARSLWSPGVGLRIDLLGRVLRVDGATALGRGGVILSAGWVETW